MLPTPVLAQKLEGNTVSLTKRTVVIRCIGLKNKKLRKNKKTLAENLEENTVPVTKREVTIRYIDITKKISAN